MLELNPVLASLQIFKQMGLKDDLELGPEYIAFLHALVDLRNLVGEKIWQKEMLSIISTPPEKLPKYLSSAQAKLIWGIVDHSLNIIYTRNS